MQNFDCIRLVHTEFLLVSDGEWTSLVCRGMLKVLAQGRIYGEISSPRGRKTL